jgi:hypothetical protein
MCSKRAESGGLSSPGTAIFDQVGDSYSTGLFNPGLWPDHHARDGYIDIQSWSEWIGGLDTTEPLSCEYSTHLRNQSNE